ncbi:tripartite tricarboxylate transporter substrate binding protein [Streptomyces sp. N35]|uniref:Bug family tripartite tricarboxylate transporter substrate binding protein n=1 Tax=Streptomyces sp. N35 TaxID=2795730 RepID=UPI0018F38F04|nr:tripartite tricarboxylate transporter substrate binding protein [Streptomyces sp. N35]
MKLRMLLVATAALVLSACSVQGGSGDKSEADYPAEPVEFTVPQDPGGSTDLITRALAKSLEKPLGEKAVVVNKPGANGKIAGKDVFGSEADGYRVAVMPQSLFSIGPLMLDDPDAIELTDMTFIKGLAVEDYVLVVPAASPHKSVKDLTGKGDIKYGTTGPGTGSQLAQTLLFGAADVKATAVPFDGGAPTVTAALGGKVDAAAVHIAEAYKHVEAGKLRALAVFSAERHVAFPDVPTAKESGYDVVVDQRRFVAGPAGIPAEVRERLATAIDKAVQTPEYTELLETGYITKWDADGDAVGAQLDESRKRFDELAKQHNIDLKTEQ